MWLVKIGKCIVFCVYRRSYILWAPVLLIVYQVSVTQLSFGTRNSFSRRFDFCEFAESYACWYRFPSSGRYAFLFCGAGSYTPFKLSTADEPFVFSAALKASMDFTLRHPTPPHVRMPPKEKPCKMCWYG